MAGPPLTEKTTALPVVTTFDDIIVNAGGKTSRIAKAAFQTASGRYPVSNVAGLPLPATAGAGARAFVTDATSVTFGAAVVGSGTHAVPVWTDGTGWFVG